MCAVSLTEGDLGGDYELDAEAAAAALDMQVPDLVEVLVPASGERVSERERFDLVRRGQ